MAVYQQGLETTVKEIDPIPMDQMKLAFGAFGTTSKTSELGSQP